MKKPKYTIPILLTLILSLSIILFCILRSEIKLDTSALTSLPDESKSFLETYLTSTLKSLYPDENIDFTVQKDSYLEYPISDSTTDAYFLAHSDSLNQSFEIYYSFDEAGELINNPVIYCVSPLNYCRTPSGPNIINRPTIYNTELLPTLGFSPSAVREIISILESNFSVYYLKISNSSTNSLLILSDETGQTYSYKVSLTSSGEISLYAL